MSFNWSEMMRMVKAVVFAAGLLAMVPGLASAQEKRWHINLGGGPTFMGGDLGDKFETGWGPAFGLTFDANERVGIQVEYAYRWFNVNDHIDAQGGRLSANHQTHQLDFNLVMNLTPADSKARLYLIAGPGAYYREVELTEYVGSGIICDPWYYVCGTYPVDAVIGSRGGWDFGFNFGGGVGFNLGEGGVEFTIETRYHYVKGPDIQPIATPKGDLVGGGSADGHYYPLTFGFRF
jgi:opacity protein-like surface antigen